MSVVVTGGGTGGHIYPAIAVAEAMRTIEPEIEVAYIGGIGGREQTIVPQHGLRFIGVPARKIRKTVSLDTIVTLLVLYRGYFQARRILRQMRVTAVLGTGGYVAAAAALAAAHLRIPVIIHEQNAVAGRTNKWLARKVDRVCITFAASAHEFPGGKVIETGLPIRAGLISTLGVGEARARLGLPAECFTLLAVGGSQGAAAINTVVRDAMDDLDARISVIHQTGAWEGGTKETIRDAACGSVYRPYTFIDTDTLAMAYRAADVVVCRCGASTLTEIWAAGLPAVLVPYPLAYADHQTANARAMVESGAGILVPQSELTARRLVDEVHALRDDELRRARMAQASLSMARPDAARTVAQVVLDCAARHGRSVT